MSMHDPAGITSPDESLGGQSREGGQAVPEQVSPIFEDTPDGQGNTSDGLLN